MTRIALSLIVVAALTSCAMQETHIYSISLSSGPSSSSFQTDRTGTAREATIVLVVQASRYLTQPYIAYRSSPYQLSIAKYSKWDSSPEEIVAATLKEGLSLTGLFREARNSHIVSQGAYAMEIDLRRFERSDEGDVTFADIAFGVSLVSPEGKTLYCGDVSEKIKLEDRSFLSLAKGLSKALEDGVEEVKREVEKSLGG